MLAPRISVLRVHGALPVTVLASIFMQLVGSAPAQCGSVSLQLFRSVTDLEAYVANISSSLLFAYDGIAQEASYATASGSDSETADDSESITNNQEEGVDEGGIVKAYGEFLIVLRRGRIFSVHLGAGSLETVSVIDAFAKDTEPASWYDEMLVIDRTIVVIGYSYHGGGATEIGLFSIDIYGKLAYLNSYHLSSNDYYSSRNYASRLVGSKLVLYLPHYLLSRPQHEFGQISATKITYPQFGSKARDDWSNLVTATDIYAPLPGVDGPVLHTVVTCSLVQNQSTSMSLSCDAHGVLGPSGRVFYVSQEAVYVWVAAKGSTASILYRFSFDGLSAPSALQVRGSPVDQLSFKEENAFLSVLLRSDAVGDAMWAAEASSGSVMLMRVPLTFFKPGLYCNTSTEHFTALPLAVDESSGTFQNRHIGDFVLYGLGAGLEHLKKPGSDSVYIYNRNGGTAATELRLSHSVERIEALGDNGIVIGNDGAHLYFSMVALERQPLLGGQLARKGATQGDVRTHGFFYKDLGNGTGMLGLPIRGAHASDWSQLESKGSSVLYLQVQQREFSRLGELFSNDGGGADDCAASCADWYGNSRPLFYRGRVLALLGYELIEAAVLAGSLEETYRIHLFPQARAVMDAAPPTGEWVIISASGDVTHTFGEDMLDVASGAAEYEIFGIVALVLHSLCRLDITT